MWMWYKRGDDSSADVKPSVQTLEASRSVWVLQLLAREELRTAFRPGATPNVVTVSCLGSDLALYPGSLSLEFPLCSDDVPLAETDAPCHHVQLCRLYSCVQDIHFFISFHCPSHGSAHMHRVCKFLFSSFQTLHAVPPSFQTVSTFTRPARPVCPRPPRSAGHARPTHPTRPTRPARPAPPRPLHRCSYVERCDVALYAQPLAIFAIPAVHTTPPSLTLTTLSTPLSKHGTSTDRQFSACDWDGQECRVTEFVPVEVGKRGRTMCVPSCFCSQRRFT